MYDAKSTGTKSKRDFDLTWGGMGAVFWAGIQFVRRLGWMSGHINPYPIHSNASKNSYGSPFFKICFV